MAVELDQKLSHYRLVEKIGEGGMGVVYRAHDERLDRDVALKVLPPGMLADEQARKRFRREALALSKLNHPNIETVHDFDSQEGVDFLVIEFIPGETLDQKLSAGALPEKEVVRLGSQLVEGLSAAHAQGVVHRDLKPGNLRVTPDGRLKILDFGIAELMLPAAREATTEVFTLSGSAGGTLPYMTPEQLRGASPDPRSDLYSFGVVLFEMATGRRPFQEPLATALVDDILHKLPPPPGRLQPDLSPRLEEIILKCLEKDPEHRYQSARDLLADFRRLAAPDTSPIPARSQRPAGWRVRISVAILMAAVLGFASYFAWQRIRPSPRVDPATIMILPMKVRGQTEGADYTGQAFAEAIARTLSQAEEINVLPVPEKGLAGDAGLSGNVKAARREGAGRLLTGALTREGDAIQATLDLVDTTENRVVWGAHKDGSSKQLSLIASALARELAEKLGASMDHLLYDRPLELLGSPEMAASPETSRFLGAIRHLDVKAALEATERLVATFPDELAAWVLLASVQRDLWQNDRTEENRMAYERSLTTIHKVDPGSPYQAFFQAKDLLLDGRPAQAIMEFRKLLKRDDLTTPFQYSIINRLAWAEWETGDYAGALEDAETSLRYDPIHTETYCLLSFILRTMDRPEEALVRARQARDLDPFGAWSNMELAETLSQLGRYEEALPYSARMCEIAGDAVHCGAHAANLQKAGKATEALAVAQEAAAMPESQSGSYNIAGYWALAGNKTQANRFLRRALALGLSDEYLAEDPAFQALHGNPEFEAILAEVEERIRSGGS